MNAAVLLFGFLLSFSCSLAQEVKFPAKAGEYSLGSWKYVYTIRFKGSRSEQRFGRLFLKGEEVSGKFGEVRKTKIGTFVYFGGHPFQPYRYNGRWLNTLTYNERVFSLSGDLTDKTQKWIQSYLKQSAKMGEGKFARDPE